MNEDTQNTQELIFAFLSKNTNWSYEENRLKADYDFDSFEQAIEALNLVAEVSAKLDHHPLITNVYNRLSFSLCTHSAGNTVTEKDIALAEGITKALAK